jgi:hypothetical protein
MSPDLEPELDAKTEKALNPDFQTTYLAYCP